MARREFSFQEKGADKFWAIEDGALDMGTAKSIALEQAVKAYTQVVCSLYEVANRSVAYAPATRGVWDNE
jgi:hypothetical protein